MHLKSSFWNMIWLYGCTIIIFTIKYNQGQFNGCHCRQHNHLKLMHWNYKKISVYGHPTDSFNVTF